MVQEINDIRYWVQADARFNVRAAVILRHGPDILVTPDEDQPGKFKLPGGAVKFGESGIVAAAREMKEELKLTTLTFAPAGTVEAFFTLAGTHYHQIVLVNRCQVTATQAKAVAQLDPTTVDLAPDTKLRWVPVSQVRGHLLPPGIDSMLDMAAPYQYGVSHH